MGGTGTGTGSGSGTGSSGSSSGSPCASCKLLRRRCAKDCIFAPYFPPEDPHKFAIVHKVFGAANVSKMLQDLPVQQRADAVSSLVYEANARIRDPVYGCVGAISYLQHQVSQLQMQLAVAQAEILCMQMQMQMHNQDSATPPPPPPPSSSVQKHKEFVDGKSYLSTLQHGFGGNNIVPQVVLNNNVNLFPTGNGNGNGNANVNVMLPPQEPPLKKESLWT